MNDTEKPTSPSRFRSVRVSRPEGKPLNFLSGFLVLAPLALFAELLIEKTHHRPLGAVTYASVALLLWGIAEVISRSALSDETELGARRQTARRALYGISAGANALLLLRALF